MACLCWQLRKRKNSDSDLTFVSPTKLFVSSPPSKMTLIYQNLAVNAGTDHFKWKQNRKHSTDGRLAGSDLLLLLPRLLYLSQLGAQHQQDFLLKAGWRYGQVSAADSEKETLQDQNMRRLKVFGFLFKEQIYGFWVEASLKRNQCNQLNTRGFVRKNK